MLHEYFGIEEPDEFADPIGYHLWVEANQCPCCNGHGWRLYNVRNRDPIEHDCQCCQGSGMRDDDWECTGLDHSEYE